MKRQWRMIIELIIIVISIALPPIAQAIFGVESTKWLGLPAYYIGIAIVVLGLFAVLWLWSESNEPSDIDELEERMEQRFDQQNQQINFRMDKISKAIGHLTKKGGRDNGSDNPPPADNGKV